MRTIIILAIFVVGFVGCTSKSDGTTSEKISASKTSKSACYQVEGMTCASCEITLKSAVKKLDGIENVQASVEKKHAVVRYEPSKTNPIAIGKKIDSIGYKATNKECSKKEG